MSECKFFWDTMKKCDWSTEGDGDDDKILKPVVNYLAKLDDIKIFEFDKLMTQLLYDLDSRKLFDIFQKLEEYPSDDVFLYARCVALINGEKFYNNVKTGKNNTVWTMEFESLLYVPSNAWGQKHNKDSGEYPYISVISYETGSNTALWQDENQENADLKYTNLIDRLSKAILDRKYDHSSFEFLKGATLKGSKLGGCPYIPKDGFIPKNSKGEYLIMIAQINLSEILETPLPQKHGILQFWIGNDENYGADFDSPCSQENFRVIYYPVLVKNIPKNCVLELFSEVDFENNFSFPLVNPLYNEYKFRKTKFQCVYPCQKDINYSNYLVKIYNETYPNEPIQNVYDDILTPAKDFSTANIKACEFLDPFEVKHFKLDTPDAKLLTYPKFIQDDPRKNRFPELHDYILLFQLTSRKLSGGALNWKNNGIARWMIHPDDLAIGDFSKVWYSWDC